MSNWLIYTVKSNKFKECRFIRGANKEELSEYIRENLEEFEFILEQLMFSNIYDDRNGSIMRGRIIFPIMLQKLVSIACGEDNNITSFADFIKQTGLNAIEDMSLNERKKLSNEDILEIGSQQFYKNLREIIKRWDTEKIIEYCNYSYSFRNVWDITGLVEIDEKSIFNPDNLPNENAWIVFSTIGNRQTEMLKIVIARNSENAGNCIRNNLKYFAPMFEILRQCGDESDELCRDIRDNIHNDRNCWNSLIYSKKSKKEIYNCINIIKREIFNNYSGKQIIKESRARFPKGSGFLFFIKKIPKTNIIIM